MPLFPHPTDQYPSKQARVEEVADVEAGGLPKDPFVQYSDAGETSERGKTLFEAIHEERVKAGVEENPWAPFKDKDEWSLALWLMRSGLSQANVDRYLKLEIVSLYLS